MSTHQFNVPERFFKLITRAVSTLLLIVLLYVIKYIFDMDFVCSCQLHTTIHPNIVLYMLVPPLILTWVSTTLETFRSRSNNSSWQGRCPTSIRRHWRKLLMSYFILTSVWIVTVLIDGDWFFCLQTNQNSSQVGMPCKKELSQDEILTRAAYKSTSLAYGFYTILGLVGIWIIWINIQACCVEKGLPCRCWPCSTARYQVLYEDLMEEQVHNCLIDKLTKIATKRAELICERSLTGIREDHQSLTSVGEEIQTAWSLISATDFYLRESNTPEEAPDQAAHQARDQALPQAPDQAPDQAPPQAPHQAPPQAPDQAPPQAPPQAPHQAPPQAPDQKPPQAPHQAPHQAPPQAPPQAPDQAPHQAPPQAPHRAPEEATPAEMNLAEPKAS